jgi:ABC-type tungstate transport system substrate-binding protein
LAKNYVGKKLRWQGLQALTTVVVLLFSFLRLSRSSTVANVKKLRWQGLQALTTVVVLLFSFLRLSRSSTVANVKQLRWQKTTLARVEDLDNRSILVVVCFFTLVKA